ncbi:MAG: hypothetical protein WC488_03685 [Candidatus Micrarchaeia archaeon]
MKSIFLLMVLASSLSFAAYTSQCDAEYEQCMSSCCSKCGATVGMENNAYVCWVWATKNLDQVCMSSCSYCYANYSGCVMGDVQGDQTNLDNLGQPLLNNSGPAQGGSQSGASNASQHGTPTSGEINPLCGPLFLMLGLGAMLAARK